LKEKPACEKTAFRMAGLPEENSVFLTQEKKMKKFLVVLAVTLLLIGAAGQASAFFYNSGTADLIRVVYQTTVSGGTLEQATDLGSISSIEQSPSGFSDSGYNLYNGDGTHSFSSSAGTGGDLEVAYFASDGTSPSNFTKYWTSGPQSGTVTNAGFNSFKNNVWTATNTVLTNYENGTTSTYDSGSANVWALLTLSKSYYKELDKNGAAPGSFDQYIGNLGEIALVSGGSVTQGLYAWTSPTTESTISPELELVTTLTGGVVSTEVLSATPIPPTVLLFGSGLIGLIGVMRKRIV
jgi:hypothetical protein